MINEYDKRQLNQLLKMIYLMEANEISISKFISDQWELIEIMQTVDLNWRKKYYDLINKIEDIYATALDRNKKLDETDYSNIKNILAEMKYCINER